MDLKEIRIKIDECDKEIVKLLEERFNHVADIAEYKYKNNIEISDTAREFVILDKVGELTQNEKYSPYIKDIYKKIMNVSKDLQKELRMKDKNIVLIGMPGCGKSLLGSIISLKLNKPFYDVDSLIEKEQGSEISEIFSLRGEKFFRELEKNKVTEVAVHTNAVISTGGGVINNPENMERLRKNGIIIFIDRNIEDIINEDMSMRPLVAGDKEGMLRKLYDERISLYKSHSDYIIKNDKYPRDVADEIIKEVSDESFNY